MKTSNRDLFKQVVFTKRRVFAHDLHPYDQEVIEALDKLRPVIEKEALDELEAEVPEANGHRKVVQEIRTAMATQKVMKETKVTVELTLEEVDACHWRLRDGGTEAARSAEEKLRKLLEKK